MKLHTTDPMADLNVIDVEGLEQIVYEQLTLNDDEEAPLLVFGAPGIGKTAILREALHRLPDGQDWKLIIKTLSTETADNFFLPRYTNGENYQDKAEDVPKTWLPVYKETGNPQVDEIEDKKLGKGLLFIDELSRAIPQVLNVCLSLVHERIFNGYRVGSGWKIICASNRPEDEIVGQTDISNALLSRFAIVYFEPSAEQWSKWALTQNHIPPQFLQWIQMGASENLSGNQYFYWDANELGKFEYRANSFCMPRTWDKAFRRVAKMRKDRSLQGFNLLELPQESVRRCLSMYIPREPIGIFFSYLNTVRAVGDFKQVLNMVWNGDKSRTNVLSKKELQKIELPLIQFIISSHADKFPTAKEFDNLCNWLVDSDSDSLTSYALDILFNVFSEGLQQTQKDIFFMGVHRYNKLCEQKEKEKKNPGLIKMYDTTCAQLCEKWGWKNLSEAPDWFSGFNKLQEKFAQRFASIKIDDKDALD